MYFADLEFNRMKNLLAHDKTNNPKSLNSVIKSEIMDVLLNYMDVNAVNFNVGLNKDNTWTVAITANVKSFYAIKSSFVD